MTISLYNRIKVDMLCDPPQPTTRVRVENAQGAQQYFSAEETLFVEIDPEILPFETTITVHGGEMDAYVWEQDAAGIPVRWERDGSGFCHRKFVGRVDASLQVVALTAGSPPPAGPPTPGSGQAILKVKVRKKGDLPI